MLAALCVLASLSMHAKAQERKEGKEGMVVVRDPQTGKMRAPTPEELRELRAHSPQAASLAGKQAAAPAAIAGHIQGARGVRLGEESLVYDVVTRGPDGKLTSQCVHGEAAAKEALTAPLSAPVHHEEHDHEAR
jgi:hypothetical protein